VKEKIAERLAETFEKLEELKSKINESDSPDDLSGVVAEIREVWKDLRYELRVSVHSYAVEKFRHLYERLEQVRDRLEAQGVDTSELDEMLSDINDTIKDLEEAVGTPEFEGKVKEAKDLFAEAFEKVKEIVREREEVLEAKVLGYESVILKNLNLLPPLLASTVAIFPILFAFAYFLSSKLFDRAKNIAITYSCGMKNLPIALAIAIMSFGTLTALPIAVAFAFQMLTAVAFYRIYRAKGGGLSV